MIIYRGREINGVMDYLDKEGNGRVYCLDVID